jgi:hypothetical protein
VLTTLSRLPRCADGFGANYGVMHNGGAASNFTQFGVSNAWREKRAMLQWWAAQIELVRSMMLEMHAEERLRLGGERPVVPSSARRVVTEISI